MYTDGMQRASPTSTMKLDGPSGGATPGAGSPKARTLSELRRRILTLDLAPGAELDETRLSEAYGMSRTPLREVLRALAGEGYITLRSNRSAVVAPMSPETMRAFFQSAPMIYASIARLAAEGASSSGVGALKDIQHRFRGAVAEGDVDRTVVLNDAFHAGIGELAGNPYLTPSLRRLLIDHARIGQTFWRPRNAAERDAIRMATEQHDAMIDAIERGDGDEAVAVTLAHWDLSRDRMERYVRPDPLPVEPA